MAELGLSTILHTSATVKRSYRFRQDPPLDPLQLQAHIDAGVVPIRNREGSSGSYRLRNLQGDPVAIFKPAAEEPYALGNPKWSKWLQRHLVPCWFGRACLPNGHGWLSERAAWLTDEWLGLGIVPRTEIVQLHSSAFSLAGAQAGSMQEWVMGFKAAPQVMHDMERMPQEHPQLTAIFWEEWQKLVILDLLIGNTDRNLDNWLIHLSWKQTSSRSLSSSGSQGESSAVIRTSSDSISLSPMASIILNPIARNTSSVKDPRLRMEPVLKIAAIDNGLAFPHLPANRWMHHSSWLWMPQAHLPLAAKWAVKLRDDVGWSKLQNTLLTLFEPTGQAPDICHLMEERRQSVLQAIEEQVTPWELVCSQQGASCLCFS